MWKFDVFIKLLVLAALIRVLLILWMPDVALDSSLRYSVGKSLRYGGGFSYLNNLNFLPFFVVVEASIVTLGGCLQTVRFLSAFSSVATGWVVYKICGASGFNHKNSMLAAAFTIFNPFLVLFGALGMSESLLTLLITSTLYLIMRGRGALASILFLLAVLTKYEAWVLIPVFIGYFLHRQDRRAQLLFLTVSALGIGCWMVVNYGITGDPIHFVRCHIDITNMLMLKYNAVLWIEKPVLRTLLYPVVYPLTFTSVFWVGTIWEKRGNPLLVYTTVLYTVIVTGVASVGALLSWGRYFHPLIPLYVVLGMPYLLRFSTRRRAALAVVYFVLSTVMAGVQAVLTYKFMLAVIQ